VTHVAVSCDDGDACTADACDPAVGCGHTLGVKLDDDNACTADACDPTTGDVSHTTIPSCCPHSACVAGAALNLACSYPGYHDDCVAAACAFDAYCCDVGWDSTCIAHAMDPNICPTGIIPNRFKCNCSHSYCATGEPLAKTCDPCVKKICEKDPACCFAVWDMICVNEVYTVCNVPSGADCK